MKLLLKNANIIDPENKYSGVYDLLIFNKIIEKISKKIDVKGFNEFDCRGNYLSPGFIDSHCHLRDPGFTHKEDLESAGKAAFAGGFTSLLALANTDPVTDSANLVRQMIQKSELIQGPSVYPYGSISKGLKGKEPTEFMELISAGAVALSDDGIFLDDIQILEKALEFSKKTGVVVALHEEDTTFGIGTEKSEFEAIDRDLDLLAKCGGRLHIQHVSLEESCRRIETAKMSGLDVTCEVTPHHLILNEKDYMNIGNNAKCSPPLRSKKDCEYLVDALSRGVVDVVATDHAPHTVEEKNGLSGSIPNGIIGFQTALSILLELVYEKLITIERVIDSLTLSPARIFGISGGRVRQGGRADIVIFNPSKKWVLCKDDILSKSYNSPFLGRELVGKIEATIYAGTIRYFSK